MAVLEIPKSYILKRCEASSEEVVDILNRLGFPTELEEGNFVVETTPDRLDMLTFEGVVRAINTFLKGETREYSADYIDGINNEGVESRPYIIAFIAEGVEDKEELYESLILAQEKIHLTFGRKRRKIAIGVHDLDKVKLPLTYKEVEEERFIPLGWEREASVKEILEKHEKGIAYSNLVGDRFPMLYDQEGVISFPPIINSERTKISEETTNFLFEMTGVDEAPLMEVAKVLATAMADRGAKISILKVDGEEKFSLKRKEIPINLDYVKKISGVAFKEEDVRNLLTKSDVEYGDGVAKAPCYRYDLNTERDVVEEVLINKGYENIMPKGLEFYQTGELDEEWRSFRNVFLYAGFMESQGFFLIKEELQKKFFDDVEVVLDAVSNEHNSLRTSVLLTLLNSEEINQMEELPHKMFEIGRVYRNGKEFTEVGFLLAGVEANIDEGISVLKRVFENEGIENLKEHNGIFSSFFIEGRSYEFECGEYSGVVGEIHPSVNELFNIPNAMVAGLIWKR